MKTLRNVLKKQPAEKRQELPHASRSTSSIDVHKIDISPSNSDVEIAAPFPDNQRARRRDYGDESEVTTANRGRQQSNECRIWRNPVLSVVEQVSRVLQISLPRYIVAVLVNYRRCIELPTRTEQLEQLDLYLSQISENLDSLENSGLQDVAIRCGRTLAVLASVIELVGRNAPRSVLRKSFREQVREESTQGMGDGYAGGYHSPDFDDIWSTDGSVGLRLADSGSQTDIAITAAPPVKRGVAQSVRRNLIKEVEQRFIRQLDSFEENVAARIGLTSSSLRKINEKTGLIGKELIAQQNDLKRLLSEIMNRDEQLNAAKNRIQVLQETVNQQCREEQNTANDGHQFEYSGPRDDKTGLQQIGTYDHHSSVLLRQDRSYKALEKAYAELLERLERSDDENARLSKENSHLKQQLDLCHKPVSAGFVDQNVESDRGLVIRQMQAGLHAALAQNSDLQSDVEELKRQRKALIASCDEAKMENKHLKDELVDISGRLVDATAEYRRVEKNMNQIEQQLTESNEKSKQLQRTITELQKQLTQAKASQEDSHQKPKDSVKNVSCSLCSRLQSALQERENVVRAMEFGRESFIQRIGGLQVEKAHCEEAIRELRQQMSKLTQSKDEELLKFKEKWEAQSADLLSRLAQKGEQYELVKDKLDMMIGAQEEMNLRVEQANTARAQADARAERINDQRMREIDELELQIRSLQEEKAGHCRAPLTEQDASTMTDEIETCIGVNQTSLSFQLGYDMETGMRISECIFYKYPVSRECQTAQIWSSKQAGVQVDPQRAHAAVQVAAETYNAAVQCSTCMIAAATNTEAIRVCWASSQTSDIIHASEPKGEDTSPPDLRQIPLLDLLPDVCVEEKKLPSMDDLDWSGGRSLSTTSSSLESLTDNIVPSAILDMDPTEHGNNGQRLQPMESAHELSAAPPKPPRLAQRLEMDMSGGDHCRETLRLSFCQSLSQACTCIYDALIKNPDSKAAVIQLSESLEYDEDDELFYHQLLEGFLDLYREVEAVQNVIHDNFGNEGFDFEDIITNFLIDKKGLSQMRSDLQKYYIQVYGQVNPPAIAQRLRESFELYITCIGNGRGNVSKSLYSDNLLRVETFVDLPDFNCFLAETFIALAPVSRRLRKIFQNWTPGSDKTSLATHLRFAERAQEFAVSSGKLRKLLDDNVAGGQQRFMEKFERTLRRNEMIFRTGGALGRIGRFFRKELGRALPI